MSEQTPRTTTARQEAYARSTIDAIEYLLTSHEQLERETIALTAELEASNKRYHRLRESVNGMAPRDLERLEYFEKNYFGLEEANRGLTAELATVKQRLEEAEKVKG